jgi:SAM-dependent methyltransferase
MPESVNPQQVMQQQAGKLLALVAGFGGVKTIEMGLEQGLLAELAKHPDGLDVATLASRTKLDPAYVAVWCRCAYAAELLDADANGVYRLAPAMGTLLLDRDAPAYMGALFGVLPQPEFFDTFAQRLRSGERVWWDQFRPEFIHRAAAAGRGFYTRLVPAGLQQIPGLAERLERGGRVLELACGAGHGLARMAHAYPQCTFVGVDGDTYSLELAAKTLKDDGLASRVQLRQSTLEDFTADGEFDVVLTSISLHEARDLERVTGNVHRALAPGGFFVISDFPFPDSHEQLRTVPGRVMAGVQYFEAQINAQLLPVRAFVDLLARHGFHQVNAFTLTPLHAIIHGRK